MNAMIQRNYEPRGELPTAAAFSAATRQAIVQGVLRDDPVAELEFLGLSTRYINLLENSPQQILSLEQLVQLRPDQLLEIPNFGRSGLEELMAALARYDQLEETKRAMAIRPKIRPK